MVFTHQSLRPVCRPLPSPLSPHSWCLLLRCMGWGCCEGGGQTRVLALGPPSLSSRCWLRTHSSSGMIMRTNLYPSSPSFPFLPRLLASWQAINELKAGRVEYRADKGGIVHLAFGKTDFAAEDLLLNLTSIVESIAANKPPGAKGIYWKNAYVSSTMGPSVKLNLEDLLSLKREEEAK